MAPRSQAEIVDSFVNSVTVANPGIAVETGPLRRGWINPIGAVLAPTEAAAAHLNDIVSLNFAAAASFLELTQVGAAFGLEPLPGAPSRGFVTFFTAVRPQPTDVLTVPVGTIVQTSQGGFSYQTTETRSLLGSNADAYFVAARRRFEILVPIAALAVGEDSDMPPTAINQIVSDLPAFQGVINLSQVKDGLSAESSLAFAARIQDRLLGIDQGVNGGLIDSTERFDQSVRKVVPVYSTDVMLFYRRTARPAIDLYVSGEYDRQVTDVLTARGGETSFVLTNQPTVSITAVTVNGTAVSFSLLLDSTRGTGGSTIATDKIVLQTPLNPGDLLQVDYVANGLLLDLQATFTPEGASSRFGTQILLRSFFDVPIIVGLDIAFLSTFDPVAGTDAVNAEVFSFVSGDSEAVLSPASLRDDLLQNVPGLSRVGVKQFQRADGGASTGVITIAKNELSSTNSGIVSIGVSSA